MGYGPRFLHSTGQLHKGGPDKGIFLQIVDTPQKDIQVPGKDYSFGSIIKAQSLGDFQALKQENRRILRIDLLNQPLKGLQKLVRMIKA
jgi:transaldolase/glucose-6-phosphate isomerase